MGEIRREEYWELMIRSTSASLQYSIACASTEEYSAGCVLHA